MDTLTTKSARLAYRVITNALDELDADDWNAVTRALGVYKRPAITIPPGLDLDSSPSITPPTQAPTPFLAPPRPPG